VHQRPGLVGEVGQVKQSAVCRYEFSPQDHKFKVGGTPDDPFTGGAAGEVVRSTTSPAPST
jgi:hypothetical protein